VLSVLSSLETSAFATLVEVVAARRFFSAAVVAFGLVPAVEARARQQLGRAAGGSLMVFLLASLPLGAADRQSVDTRGRAVDLSQRWAVLKRFWWIFDVSIALAFSRLLASHDPDGDIVGLILFRFLKSAY